MAVPDEYEKIMSIKRKKKFRRQNYLPLMYSNDMFIVSSIMKRIIKTVVWVVPNWSTRQKKLEIADEYIGVTIHKNDEQLTTCHCEKILHPDPSSHYSCHYSDRNNDSAINIPESTCRSINKFKRIYLSEDVFEDVLNSRRALLQNVFIDIDEDYFGVESGVQQYVNMGVSLETQERVDQALTSIFCPWSVETERVIEQELKSVLQIIADHINTNRTYLIKHKTKLEEQLYKKTMQFFCRDTYIHKEMLIEELFDYILTLKNIEIQTLPKLRYCCLSSPQLTMSPRTFSICHGNIFPEDKLNEIHIHKTKDIEKKGRRLSRILLYLTRHSELKLFTIARSLRDGYTPRKQQRFIEKQLLDVLGNALEKVGKKMHVVYDHYLVSGDFG